MPTTSAIIMLTLANSFMHICNSRFQEALLTLKEKFPNILVGFRKFRWKIFSMLCSRDSVTSCLDILSLKNILFNNLSTNWLMM